MSCNNLPTKIELLHHGLVVMNANHKNVTSNSIVISNELNRPHYDVMKKVKFLLGKGLLDKRNIKFISYADSANRPRKYYDLDEKATLQVVMGFSGDRATQLHENIAESFVSMRAELQVWRANRNLASKSTATANDSIQLLKHELDKIIPTSRRCTMLYIHIQNAINKAATGTIKVNRNSLTTNQLEVIKQLEENVRVGIDSLLGKGTPPEEVRDTIINKIKDGELQASL